MLGRTQWCTQHQLVGVSLPAARSNVDDALLARCLGDHEPRNEPIRLASRRRGELLSLQAARASEGETPEAERPHSWAQSQQQEGL